jgi:hypothetical protein
MSAMSKEWVLPHDPELIYLREKIKRLEEELEGYRLHPDKHSIIRPPETLEVRGLPPAVPYRIYSLEPLAEAQAENEPIQNRYHVILRGGSGDGSIGYGYYVSHHELYGKYDICGLMAHLHERTVYSLARFIEQKRERGKP